MLSSQPVVVPVSVSYVALPVMVPDVRPLVEPLGTLLALEAVLVHLVRLHHVGLHLLRRHLLVKESYYGILLLPPGTVEYLLCSVADPHFGVDPDPDPWIRASH
jgi:hypothetical protein